MINDKFFEKEVKIKLPLCVKVLLVVVLCVYPRCERCSGSPQGEVGGEATSHREPVSITLLPGEQAQEEAGGGSWGLGWLSKVIEGYGCHIGFLRVLGFM